MFSLSDLEVILESDSEFQINLKDLDILSKLLKTLKDKKFFRSHAILQIWLAFNYFHSNETSHKKKALKLIKDFINNIKSDEIELFRPCTLIEFFINELGLRFLFSGTKSEKTIAKDLFRLALDFVKMDNKINNIAVVSYNLAFSYYKSKEIRKAARLFEISSLLFEEESQKANCQILAAKLYYPLQIERSIKLLENAKKLIKKLELTEQLSIISKKLNDFRREILISYEGSDNDVLFHLIEELTENYHKDNDLLNLAAVYYEAGIILSKLGYSEAYQYLSEASRISADIEAWKLYAKATLQISMHTIELKQFNEAEELLKDLDQVGHYLVENYQDNSILTKVESLFQAIQKIQQKESQLHPPEVELRESEFKTESVLDSINDDNNLEIHTTPEITDNNINIETDVNSSFDVESQNQGEIESLINVPNEEIIQYPAISEIITQNENREIPLEELDYYELRDRIGNHLKSKGYDTIHYDKTPFRGTITIDIIAKKGKVRKRKIFIMISPSPPEASIASNLLSGITETGKKYIFLQSGNPELVDYSDKIKIIKNIDDIRN